MHIDFNVENNEKDPTFEVGDHVNPVTLGNNFASKLTFVHKGRVEAKYKGNWLIQDNISCTHRNAVNLFIVYELDTWSRDLNTDFTLGDYLFGAVMLTKNADPDKYGCVGYGIGFEAHSQFLSSDGELGKNDVIFGVDNSSSMHADNRKKRYLCSSLRPNRWIIWCYNNNSLNILWILPNQKRTFVLSLHCNGGNSFFYANGVKMYQFKAKDSKIKPCPFCLGNISKDFTVDNTKKTGLNGYMHDFSVDYNSIETSDIWNIHIYSMKKHDMI